MVRLLQASVCGTPGFVAEPPRSMLSPTREDALKRQKMNASHVQECAGLGSFSQRDVATASGVKSSSETSGSTAAPASTGHCASSGAGGSPSPSLDGSVH